jgi:hypothetical protein
MTSPELPPEQLAPIVKDYLEMSTRLLLEVGAAAVLNKYTEYKHYVYDPILAIPAINEVQRETHTRDQLYMDRVDAFVNAELPLAIYSYYYSENYPRHHEVLFRYYSLAKVDPSGWRFDGRPIAKLTPEVLELFMVKDDKIISLVQPFTSDVSSELIMASIELAKTQEAIGWSPRNHANFPWMAVNNPDESVQS